MAVNRLPVTKGIRAGIEALSGKPCFIAKLPRDQSRIPPPPYSILYPLDIGNFGGSMADGAEDSWLGYQVTSVGKDGAGAEWLGDKVRDFFLGKQTNPTTGAREFKHPIDAGTGQQVMTRRPQAGAGGTSPSEGMVTVAEQFVVSVTPA